MGGLTGAVHWWEESQLRVLVLASLVIQFFLFSFPILRRLSIPGWLSFIMWLAYHGGDAVAIYALATLFNRHKNKGDGVVGGVSSSGNTLLEVVWAPVLLIHLGGYDGVTAYNIEDNELWTRHLLTAVSQVTVAVYVFCKSWPSGGDKRLLQTAILLFIIGVVKCFMKAWAFKRASIYSLVTSADAAKKQTNDGSMYTNLEEYVKLAREDIVLRQHPEDDHQVMEDEVPVRTIASRPWALVVMAMRPLALLFWLQRLSSIKDVAAEGSSNHPRSRLKGERQEASLFEERGTVTVTCPPRVVEWKKRALALLSSSKDEAADGSSNHPPSRLRGERQEARNNNSPTRRRQARLSEERGETSKLFVDLSSPYPSRISIFKKFWGLREEIAYDSVQGGLVSAFFRLYTKLKTAAPPDGSNMGNGFGAVDVIRVCIPLSRMFVPWAPIALFHQSHREAYNGIDIKVTYALLCCTAVLEYISLIIFGLAPDDPTPEVWPKTVAQYSLAGYYVRNKKHSIKMGIVSFLQCKDILDQLWCMEPSFSSARITSLVLRYLKDGWKQKIQDAASYRSFSNHSSHWGLNMNRPFDECVLLWHLATDFCFFSSSFPDHKCAFAEPRETLIGQIWRIMVQEEYTSVTRNPTSTTSGPQCNQESVECKAIQCRQMSNYMVYLLFVNPEMLLPGSRRNLFKTTYDELKGILKDREWKWNPVCWSRCTPCGVKQIKEEAIVMRRLIEVMTKKGTSQEESSKEATKATVMEIAITVTQQKSERSSQDRSSMEGSNKQESFTDEAWDIAQKLMEMDDEVKRWKEIEDVWVQMLCFSASRCRGYLHAKALGKGGEFLSYVWLLLFYMGMETFSERLQRELLQRKFHKGTYPPPNSEVSTSAGTPPASEVQTCAGAITTSTSEICMAKDNMG